MEQIMTAAINLLTALILIFGALPQDANAVQYSATGAVKCERSDYPIWLDIDKDGCDTRCEVLKRDSLMPVTIEGNRVVTGLWVDPYTAKIYSQASMVTIDHIIAICEADRAGGSAWTRAKRAVFANDEDNLITTGRSSNSSKGAKSEADWMPANIAHWGDYLATREMIRARYGMAETQAEKDRVKKLAGLYFRHKYGIRGVRVKRRWFRWFSNIF